MHSSERAWRERGLHSAVLAGDERAWQTWYEQSFAGLYAYVCWRCAGMRDHAEEVVQETWLTAVRRIRHFDPDQGSFAAWLQGIAANSLRNHFRREQRRVGRPLTENHAVAASQHTALDERDRASQIALALAELPARYEAVLRAKYCEQQRVAEIAATWNETVKTIESLLTRARQAFRAAYLHLEPDHERQP